jgi:hypothetical protein
MFAVLKFNMKKEQKRKTVGIEEETIYTDHKTGETVVTKKRKFYKIKYDLYSRLFKNGLLEVGDDLTGNDFRVLHYLLGEVRDSSNIVQLTYANYKELTEGMFRGSTLPSFRRSVRNLIECNVIKRVMQNVYMVNPEISHGGSEDDRKEMILEYEGINERDLNSIEPIESPFAQDKEDYARLIGNTEEE